MPPAGLVLCGLFLWQAGSLKLGFTVLGGLAAGLLLFGLLAWLLLHSLYRVSQRNGFLQERGVTVLSLTKRPANGLTVAGMARSYKIRRT